MLRRTVRMWRARVARRVGVPLALLGLVTGFSPLASTVAAQAGTMQNYIVLYGGSAVPADAAASIGKAGGTLVYSYGQIGVAIARSDTSNFRANILRDNRVEGASATAAFATKLNDDARSTTDANGLYTLRLPVGQSKIYMDGVPDGFEYPSDNLGAKIIAVAPTDTQLAGPTFKPKIAKRRAEPEGLATVRGRVVDPSGKPIKGISIADSAPQPAMRRLISSGTAPCGSNSENRAFGLTLATTALAR